MRFMFAAFALFLAALSAFVFEGSIDHPDELRGAEQTIAVLMFLIASLQGFGAWCAFRTEGDGTQAASDDAAAEDGATA